VPRYRVIYAVDVSAENSLQAVLETYAGLLSPDGYMPVFDVYVGDCHIAQIDLGDYEDEGEPEVDPRSDVDFGLLGERS
jgi:hypothetical protein